MMGKTPATRAAEGVVFQRACRPQAVQAFVVPAQRLSEQEGLQRGCAPRWRAGAASLQAAMAGGHRGGLMQAGQPHCAAFLALLSGSRYHTLDSALDKPLDMHTTGAGQETSPQMCQILLLLPIKQRNTRRYLTYCASDDKSEVNMFSVNICTCLRLPAGVHLKPLCALIQLYCHWSILFATSESIDLAKPLIFCQRTTRKWLALG